MYIHVFILSFSNDTNDGLVYKNDVGGDDCVLPAMRE